MATYAELLTASESPTLNQKIRVASFIAASTVAAEAGGTTNHTNRLLWAKQVYQDPSREAGRMIWAVLAANQAQTLANILAATDAQVQTAVNNSIDLFANGTP